MLAPKMSNKVYDFLKWLAQILLPTLGTLYFALANIWNLPNPEEVVGTITAIDLALGAILGLSTSEYNATRKGTGELLVDTSDPERDKMALIPHDEVASFKDKDVVEFKVKHVQP